MFCSIVCCVCFTGLNVYTTSIVVVEVVGPAAPHSDLLGLVLLIQEEKGVTGCQFLEQNFNGIIIPSFFLLGCYGVAPEKSTEDWKCSRCKANALEEVRMP